MRTYTCIFGILSLLFLFSCRNNDEQVLEKLQNDTQTIAENMVVYQKAMKAVVRVIFENPTLHSNFTSDKVDTRMPCPDITPDPTMPISSYPANFNLNFGGAGCEPDGTTTIAGQVELTLDGVLCEAIGTTACISFKNNFSIDGTDLDGKINLTFLGTDASGNLCFDSDIPNLEIDGGGLEVKSTSGGKLTLVDVLANNDPSDPTTFIDDMTCQSYENISTCIDGTDYILETSTNLKVNPFCPCAVGGVLIGSDTSGNPIEIDFDPNAGCTGDVLINGTASTIAACL